MLELELKAVVDDVDAVRRRVELAGGRLLLEGRMIDRRFDAPDGSMTARDEVLRTRRIEHRDGSVEGSLDWKGPTRTLDGYKAREERSARVDAESVEIVLTRLGYVRTREVERDVAMYALGDATVRFERYPRMDTLVEVEGDGPAIERAIVALGMPRDRFTDTRLSALAAEYERRTGQRAALSARDLDPSESDDDDRD
ncbi:hypothetical protein J421_2553 [Gemmatirosa kalamazoonensis]|uniref:CYTH domain-containing protein n=1 Tax=Gemmatirosa kalamazoonensis TaxID=861299 RepID=W0RIC7_9BACT|nr:hypothetical protein [Gemmatirosa kalamazoonensis]AHG90090.1 hypothetical protein J421_2553 [Gemmatirosa kalamazoonensis]